MSIKWPEGTQSLPASIIHYETFSYTTRRTSIQTPSGAYFALISGTFNKKFSNSKILVTGYSQGYGNESGAVQFRCVVGNQNVEIGGGYQYTSSSYLKAFHCNALITNNTQTGNITVSYGYRSRVAQSERPFSVQNPASNDDNRIEATGTVMHVWELAG
jgi:hypothetical protein|tara:strand:- start:341 stop:817 length:477 start_codon:yes stop_codon:yes gene_type:complete